jgi:hypothetical protein
MSARWRAVYLCGYNETMFRSIALTFVALFTLAGALPQQLVVQRAGQPPRELSVVQIANLKPITQQAAIGNTDRCSGTC